MRVWLLSFILFVTGCDDPKDNKIRIGLSPDYPPFEFNQKSNLKGFDVDLVTMIMKDNKMDFEIYEMEFDALVNGLIYNKIDIAISCISKTEKREKKIDFSKVYYVPKMTILKNKTMIANSIEDLKGKTIVAQLGTVFWEYMNDILQNGFDINLIAVDNIIKGYEMLRKEKVDAVILEMAQAKHMAGKNIDMNFIKIKTNKNYGYSIGIKKNSKIKDMIDASIVKLFESGFIDLLKRKWGV